MGMTMRRLAAGLLLCGSLGLAACSTEPSVTEAPAAKA